MSSQRNSDNRFANRNVNTAFPRTSSGPGPQNSAPRYGQGLISLGPAPRVELSISRIAGPTLFGLDLGLAGGFLPMFSTQPAACSRLSRSEGGVASRLLLRLMASFVCSVPAPEASQPQKFQYLVRSIFRP